MLILLILKGSHFLFVCFVALLCLLGLGEFYRMALPDRKIDGVMAALFGAMIPLILAGPGFPHWVSLPPDRLSPVTFFLTAFLLLFGIRILFSIRDIKASAAEAALLVMGILYVPILLVHLVWLHGLPDGVKWIFLLLIIVMSGDTAAFYTGSNLGKRKLYPIVSPNKSVEGAIGGLLGSLAGTLIARATFFPQLAIVDCIVTALVAGAFGQVGDLFESLLKRSFGVKDSGVIVPGHGGILDRLDSILFAAPVIYYYALFVVTERLG
ncbi:phosphatidate cytidylyltransferase [Geotalea uraniireducens]|uniref:Phosphatidate cytidylyltransferase n=1 Tax=Geotalea uraniireducens TaxID=351604 RepID=A0ABN6VVD1_9BACT|nr:phosphatidate cytidylyltransferase [Geotalea uraniireducens]